MENCEICPFLVNQTADSDEVFPQIVTALRSEIKR